MMKKQVIALLTLCTVVGCSTKSERNAKLPLTVVTQVATPVETIDSRTYVGVVEEREATAVSFTGMGVVRRVLVSEGQAVRRGQLLAEMDATQARNLLAGAEAAVTQARDALARYSQLHDAGSLPEVQWVEVQSKVAQAESQLAVARKNLADCQLTAPTAGIIGRRVTGAGETALPSQAVVTILDISQVKVKVAVPEAEVAAIGSTTPSTVTVEAAGVSVAGGAVEKGVVADALTHTYDVRILVDNAGGRLLPGMVASVQLSPGGPLTGAAGTIVVPAASVQQRAGGERFVWVVGDDSRARRTTVGVGRAVAGGVVVESGLQQGQRYVTEGYQKLTEGCLVAY